MKQLTEDYVSFETAKLLKEKGFDVECYDFYEQEICGVYDYDVTTPQPKHSQKYKPTNWNNEDDDSSVLYSRPSQSLALKWLREVHKIFVEPFVAIDLNGKYHYCFRLLNSICKDILEPKDLVRIDFKDSYEEAVEAALLYVLKNLI